MSQENNLQDTVLWCYSIITNHWQSCVYMQMLLVRYKTTLLNSNYQIYLYLCALWTSTAGLAYALYKHFSASWAAGSSGVDREIQIHKEAVARSTTRWSPFPPLHLDDSRHSIIQASEKPLSLVCGLQSGIFSLISTVAWSTPESPAPPKHAECFWIFNSMLTKRKQLL